MITEALDRCLEVLGDWNDHDSKIRDELIFGNETYFKRLVDPFRRELTKNLLMKADPVEKKALIKFYIHELDRTSKILVHVKRISKNTDHDIIIDILSGTRNSKTEILPFEFLFFRSFHSLYTGLFREIQLLCCAYEIPFLEICEETAFPLKTIDITISLENEKKKKPPVEKTEEPQPIRETRPVFIPEHIPQIFDFLKDFFSPSEQAELLKIMQSGGNVSKPLLFLDNGNRLADAFKQLYDCGLVIGCQKQDLQEWIKQNFKYKYRNKIMLFSSRYLKDIISTRNDKCQHPLINARFDKASNSYLIRKV